MIVYRYSTPIVGTWTAPPADPSAPAGGPTAPTSALPDPVITSSITNVAASAKAGLIDLTVSFVIPAYDPTLFNQVVEVHAISFGPTDAIPDDPNVALTHNLPEGSDTTHSLFTGVTVPVTVIGCPDGAQTLVTVIGFMEPDPTPAAAASTPAPSTTPDPTASTPATAAASATS